MSDDDAVKIGALFPKATDAMGLERGSVTAVARRLQQIATAHRHFEL
jgi:hypothetical protein